LNKWTTSLHKSKWKYNLIFQKKKKNKEYLKLETVSTLSTTTTFEL